MNSVNFIQYFSDNGYESNDSETANINFVVTGFGRPTIIPSDN